MNFSVKIKKFFFDVFWKKIGMYFFKCEMIVFLGTLFKLNVQIILESLWIAPQNSISKKCVTNDFYSKYFNTLNSPVHTYDSKGTRIRSYMKSL